MYQRRYNLPLVSLVSLTFTAFILIFVYFLGEQQDIKTLISVSSETQIEVGRIYSEDKNIIAIPEKWSETLENFSIYIKSDSIKDDLEITIEKAEEQDPFDTQTIVVNDCYKIKGDNLESFEETIVIGQRYSRDELQDVRPDTLGIYQWDELNSKWSPLASTLQANSGLAAAETEELGIYCLRGQPARRTPVVFEIIPFQIYRSIGGSLRIKGADFQVPTEVLIGEKELEIDYVSAGELAASVPPNFLTAGEKDLVIREPDGQQIKVNKGFIVLP